jgi:hypothetical protein
MPKQVGVLFLDVGQGDGTMIASPEGELILIDLGSKKNAEIAGVDAIKSATAVVIASMSYRHSDIPLLSKLLITHGDGDHYNLLTQFNAYVQIMTGKPLTISELAIGGGKSDYDQEMRKIIIDPAEKLGRLTLFDNSYHDPMAKNGTVTPKWTFASGTAKLFVLSANYQYRDSGPKNPKSLVTLLQYANPLQNIILTGDAEGVTEDAILGYYKKNLKFLESFGLKLGHHGSQAGTTEDWIEKVNQLASFASGDMKWAHPYCDTIARIVDTIGPGAALYDHKWLCGAGAGESKLYRNWTDKNGFYTTMAYMTYSPMQDPEDGKWYSPGFVQGVQYQLSLYDNGYMQLIDTLGNDSGVFDPKRSDDEKGLEVVAPSIEKEGFVLPPLLPPSLPPRVSPNREFIFA